MRTTASNPFAEMSTASALELSAGVVDEHVDASVPADDGVDCGVDRFGGADVTGDERRVAAVVADLGDRLAEWIFPPPPQHDGRAEGRQLVCDAAADAGAPSGDDGDSAFEQPVTEDGSVAVRLVRVLRAHHHGVLVLEQGDGGPGGRRPRRGTFLANCRIGRS